MQPEPHPNIVESGQVRRPTPGVGVAVVEDGRLLVVQRGNHPGRGLWAVPGGKARYGETLRAAAKREAFEETGLVVDVTDVIWAGDSIGPGDPPEWHYAIVDFIATPVSGTLRAGDDADAVGWISIADEPDIPVTPTMHELLDILRQR